MAILWEKRQGGSQYQIRQAGNSRRLYTDGVCHSEYNARKIVTGSIWDLLSIPAYFYPEGSIKRILMLGIGGGASILQLNQLLRPEQITGVELDPMHLYIARRFFEVERDNVELIEADARQWLKNYSGPAFDMIIDDLFVEDKREPVRAVSMDKNWLQGLLAHLNKPGLLVANFVSFNEIKACACFTKGRLHKRFLSGFCLSMPSLDNRVGVFLGRHADSHLLRGNLLAHPLWGRALTAKKLSYRIRDLKK